MMIQMLEKLEELLKEKYFICLVCAELTTQSKILEDCSNGGQDMCYCSFVENQWDKKT
jgi:saccharopine dehydrogenase-like NADP-dependent oxidoreductase